MIISFIYMDITFDIPVDLLWKNAERLKELNDWELAFLLLRIKD